jgi:cation channel sperm-associated protein subunit delta
MNAEYVISEINGLVTYSYSLTAATANCRSQPQNWSTFESDIENEEPFLWNREVGALAPTVHCHQTT